jgi:hypothetical protein
VLADDDPATLDRVATLGAGFDWRPPGEGDHRVLGGMVTAQRALLSTGPQFEAGAVLVHAVYYLSCPTTSSGRGGVSHGETESKPRAKPLGVRVLTWDFLADNALDGTLAEVALQDPVETSAALSWSGAAAFPSGPWGISARWLGVELRVPYWFEGYETMPQAGGYADVEVDGRGIKNYGEWIDAICSCGCSATGTSGTCSRATVLGTLSLEPCGC